MAKLFRILNTQADLAHNIVTFDGCLYPQLDKSQSPCEGVSLPSFIKRWRHEWSVDRMLARTIVTSLHHMVNVKSLTLRDFDWTGSQSETLVYGAICSTECLPSLTTLIVHGRTFYRPDQVRDHSRQLSLIIRSHPLLERLELRSGNWDLGSWIVQSDVPNLSYLMARPGDARVLIRGRPITSLFINRALTADLDAWEAPAISAVSNICVTLHYLENGVVESVVRFVVTHFKDVQELIVNGIYFHELSSLFSSFPSFCNLRTLRFGVRNLFDGTGKKMDENQRIDAIICSVLMWILLPSSYHI
ncbi:hypothetical protein FRB95_008734 [Tulasnella sp. JGI-2019a]|nr:hypothetical protein FRB95_008734 [Tulasnella sp. JGI-2019a]